MFCNTEVTVLKILIQTVVPLQAWPNSKSLLQNALWPPKQLTEEESKNNVSHMKETH